MKTKNKVINEKIYDAYKVLEGHTISNEEVLQIAKLPSEHFLDIVALAGKIKAKFNPGLKQLCTIMNAKSGTCSENCKFCAQSAHYNVEVDKYGLKGIDEIIKNAQRAKQIGSKRFGIVTSGKGVKANSKEFNVILEAISKIKNQIGIEVCASLGVMNEESAKRLKQAGLSTYHHNLETAPSFYQEICTTHPIEKRFETINAVKKAGLFTCSGGIIGMGETMEQRMELAFTLKELDVDSIPLNVLQPIEGTPIYDKRIEIKLSIYEIIKTIALFRIINPKKILKVAAGRESSLKDFMGLAFLAGADGMLQGGYLTLKGRNINEDKNFIEELENFYI